MRERRWESPAKDLICYVEEWTVEVPDDLDRLDPWPTEDVTLAHVREGWRGDFFLLAGGYHQVYQRHQAVGTYCSVSHPWKMGDALRTHHQEAMSGWLETLTGLPMSYAPLSPFP